MKILVLSERFIPEITAPSFRVFDHARIWLELGHEVTVVTCVPNFPRGKVFDGYKSGLYQEEDVEGIRVIRVWSYMTANEGFFRRTLDYISYMLSATLLSKRFPDFDVILATSPPLFTAVAGRWISRRRRRPWVFEVRDLWPASIKAVGASSGRMIDLFERLELRLYRKADRILALTNAFKRDMTSRGIPGEKIDVVTNGVDTEQFNPERVTFDAREELGISPGEFLVAYIGTTGMAHGLETILDAAALCRGDSKLRFLIMGEGAERANLEAAAKARKLTNVMFRNFVPHEQIPSYLAALNLSIVHLKPSPLFKMVIPSKIFENMAMGVPTLMAVEGESADIIRDADCGVCIAPGDPDAMAEAIWALHNDAEALVRMSENGKRAAAEKFSRTALAEAALKTLEAAIRGRAEQSAPAAAPCASQASK